MGESESGGGLISCSFCGKNQKQVRKLVAGPAVYICDECIDLCADILEDEFGGDLAPTDENVPVPRSELVALSQVLHGLINVALGGKDHRLMEKAGRAAAVLQGRLRSSRKSGSDTTRHRSPS